MRALSIGAADFGKLDQENIIGHIESRNRLKTLKRAMYGRAAPELLRARMLPV
jgi:hypothetical protein